jgi:hypothetical protein
MTLRAPPPSCPHSSSAAPHQHINPPGRNTHPPALDGWQHRYSHYHTRAQPAVSQGTAAAAGTQQHLEAHKRPKIGILRTRSVHMMHPTTPLTWPTTPAPTTHTTSMHTFGPAGPRQRNQAACFADCSGCTVGQLVNADVDCPPERAWGPPTRLAGPRHVVHRHLAGLQRGS